MSELNRKRFQNGIITPEEFHAKYAFPPGSKCHVCPLPPLTRVRILMPADELRKRDPLMEQLALVDPVAFAKLLLHTKNGPYIIVREIVACKQHTPELERAAAKTPSWCHAEINRGPGVDNPTVGGGSTLPT